MPQRRDFVRTFEEPTTGRARRHDLWGEVDEAWVPKALEDGHDNLAFFRGLAVAIPISVVLWALIGLLLYQLLS